jgi:hypothetical protein
LRPEGELRMRSRNSAMSNLISKENSGWRRDILRDFGTVLTKMIASKFRDTGISAFLIAQHPSAKSLSANATYSCAERINEILSPS